MKRFQFVARFSKLSSVASYFAKALTNTFMNFLSASVNI